MLKIHQRRLSLVLLAAALAVIIGACNKDSSNPYGTSSAGYGSTGNNPAPPPANTVFMAGMAFSPPTITVTAGTAITWQNNDSFAHTATSDSSAWNTGRVDPGGTAKITFNTPGTYPYNCVYHVSMGMRGTVIVK